MSDDVRIGTLVATGKWNEEQVRLGLRAGFKCEYCGKDLLGSPEGTDTVPQTLLRRWSFPHRLWPATQELPYSPSGESSASIRRSCRSSAGTSLSAITQTAARSTPM